MLHLMALKEVNAKEVPEMTAEEVIGLQDVDDAFVLAQAEKMFKLTSQSLRYESHVDVVTIKIPLMFIIDELTVTL